MNARRLASAVLVLVSVIAVTSAAAVSTAQTPTTVAEIQGASHISPFVGQSVNSVEGVVTARRTAGGRGVWIQDPTPDADIATSDGVFVFTNAAPTAQIGDLVGVNGTVSEFRPGGDPWLDSGWTGTAPYRPAAGEWSLVESTYTGSN